MSDKERQFPIQGGWNRANHKQEAASAIPWWLAEIVYQGYAKIYPCSARQQDLERMAERGGFSREEVVLFVQSLGNNNQP